MGRLFLYGYQSFIYFVRFSIYPVIDWNAQTLPGTLVETL